MKVGLALSLLGLIIFNIGLSYGLIKLGSICGENMGPLSTTSLQIAFIVVPFSFFLGLMATLAEPALKALGTTVQRLSGGRFKQNTLIISVAIGVASGVTLGILRIVFAWKLVSVIVPGYGITLVLTYFSSKEYVAIAWDSAGVTTGPVTVPLVLALGMGVSNATGAGGGFGILTCASFCPIMSVLICGLYLDWKKSTSSEEEPPCVEEDYGHITQTTAGSLEIEAIETMEAVAVELSLGDDDEEEPKSEVKQDKKRRSTFDPSELPSSAKLSIQDLKEKGSENKKDRRRSMEHFKPDAPQARDFKKKFPARRKAT